jgi:hypothetical protein
MAPKKSFRKGAWVLKSKIIGGMGDCQERTRMKIGDCGDGGHLIYFQINHPDPKVQFSGIAQA